MKSASTCRSEDVGKELGLGFLLGDDVSNDIVCFVSVSDLNKCVQHAGLKPAFCNNGQSQRLSLYIAILTCTGLGDLLSS